MADLEQIKKKLLQLDYAMVARNLPNGCELVSPKLNGEQYITRFEISNNKITYTYFANNNTLDTYSEKVPNYAIKSVIIANMITQCNLLGYDPSAIIFDVDNEQLSNKEFFDKIKVTLTKVGNKKSIVIEYILTQLLINGITQEIEYLVSQNKINDGYKILLSILGLNGDVSNQRKPSDDSVRKFGAAISTEV